MLNRQHMLLSRKHNRFIFLLDFDFIGKNLKKLMQLVGIESDPYPICRCHQVRCYWNKVKKAVQQFSPPFSFSLCSLSLLFFTLAVLPLFSFSLFFTHFLGRFQQRWWSDGSSNPQTSHSSIKHKFTQLCGRISNIWYKEVSDISNRPNWHLGTYTQGSTMANAVTQQLARLTVSGKQVRYIVHW